MSYIRGDYYIWRDLNENINFSHNRKHAVITEDEINLFMYLCKKRKELRWRLKKGQELFNDIKNK